MRRTGRGVVMAVLVGSVAAFISVAPALFIQSVFIGSAQRCDDQQRYEEATVGEIQTTCEEELGETPFWFPVLIIAVGGATGLAGGFVYGFFTEPKPRRRPILASRYAPPASPEAERPSG